MATGIGGTGVVTLNQVLATAAFLDGLGVTGLDQTGLSQKAGPVVSHLRLWTQDPDGSSAVGEESADLLLALDLLVATDPQHLVRASAGRTVTVASTSLVPTAGMVRGESAAPDLATLLGAVRERTRPGRLTTVDTVALATALFGDGVAANLIALGAAYQAGALPLQAASINRAIEVNGVAVERNQAAFRAGGWPCTIPRSSRPPGVPGSCAGSPTRRGWRPCASSPPSAACPTERPPSGPSGSPPSWPPTRTPGLPPAISTW